MSDIEAARAELVERGVDVSELFHDVGGVVPPCRPGRPRQRPDAKRRSYASFASFSDPDGNGWLFQEVTIRLLGRVQADDTTFGSSSELASALRRAAAAHGEHETRNRPARCELAGLVCRVHRPRSKPASSRRHKPRPRRQRQFRRWLAGGRRQVGPDRRSQQCRSAAKPLAA